MQCGRARLRNSTGVCLNKGVLCQVVAQWAIAAGLVKKEAPDGRLILLHQLVEGAVVAEHHNLRYQRYVVELTHLRGRV